MSVSAEHLRPFCRKHWSWLCAFGEGKCQEPAGDPEPERAR